jgi:ATP-dependent DNA helicase RecG
MSNDLQTLQHLLQFPENETVEFKEWKDKIDFKELCKYISALSNEARLLDKRQAWFIIGISDKRKVTGTNALLKKTDAETIDEINKHTQSISQALKAISPPTIHQVHHPDGRVLMYEITPARQGIPVSYDGHYYGRNGSSLGALSLDELDRLRMPEDWSKGIIPEASLADLDPEAVAFARVQYKKKNPTIAQEVDAWEDITFLNKAKLTINGKITRTALILLGKEESTHYLNPYVAQITWILKDKDNFERDYQHFLPPFLLSVDQVFNKIRNLKYRYLKTPDSLFPDEVDRYEPFTIREALNNCIAHQDYRGMIRVIEFEDDKLIFTNTGTFIPGSIEKVIRENAPESTYRNPFLVQAMVNLQMIETIGSGIRKMFNFQRQRYFPMPDYDFAERSVKLTIEGKVLDEDYARILAQHSDLTLEEIFLLDKVQKKKPLTSTEEKHLKSKRLIEGRKPNYYLSKKVAQQTDQKAEYSRNKALHKEQYFTFIKNAIQQHGFLETKDIRGLLWKILPEWMDDIQKNNKIRNLITELSRKGVIKNVGTKKKPIWRLDTNS